MHYARIGAQIDSQDIVIITAAWRRYAGSSRGREARRHHCGGVATYPRFLQIAENLGVKVLEVPMHPRDGLSIEALRELLGGRSGQGIRACMVTPNFSNPTGASIPEARKRELVRLCREADIAVIEDDIYGDLPHEGHAPALQGLRYRRPGAAASFSRRWRRARESFHRTWSLPRYGAPSATLSGATAGCAGYPRLISPVAGTSATCGACACAARNRSVAFQKMCRLRSPQV
jgi:hypothetical protein